jgi:hypothetical protein
MGLSDFPGPFIAVVSPGGSQRVPWSHLPGADRGSPGSHAESFQTCAGSSTTRGRDTSRLSKVPRVAFRTRRRRRRPEPDRLSRLNTWPAFSPANASLMPSRASAHDSGPVWLANLHCMELSSTTFCRSPGATVSAVNRPFKVFQKTKLIQIFLVSTYAGHETLPNCCQKINFIPLGAHFFI